MNIEKEINCSFIILVYNQWKLTLQTIDTLIKSLDISIIAKGVEILLINNGSTDPMDEGVFQFIDDNKFTSFHINYFKLNQNMGYPVGINYGISKAKGKVLIILNNDLIFSQGWLNPLLNILKEKKDIGVAAPYLSAASGIQHIGYNESDINKIHQYAEAFMRNHQGETIEVNRVIGACMVVKREVIDQVGGNDFWFGPGHYDDDDWCLRIRIAGYKIAIVGNSFIYHMGSASFRVSSWNVKEIIHYNKLKFLSKWQLATLDHSLDQFIEGCAFSNEKHYEPIHRSNFCKDHDKSYMKWDGILFVADWYSDTFTWRKKMEEIIRAKADERYFVWTPKSYYSQFSSRLQDCSELEKQESMNTFKVDKNIIGINLDVPSIYLLKFINSFNSILRIENDVINSYILKVKEEGS